VNSLPELICIDVFVAITNFKRKKKKLFISYTDTVYCYRVIYSALLEITVPCIALIINCVKKNLPELEIVELNKICIKYIYF
jgi:hypothetical protein